MKIAFDVQSLFEEKKTGIGWIVKEWIDHMVEIPQEEFQFNCFIFRNRKRKEYILEKYKSKNIEIKKCNWFPLFLYHRIWNYIPVPYKCLIRGNADITQFFNYVIPPGVKGKKGVVIYDMAYKACPETMEDANRIYLSKNLGKTLKRADFIITISQFSKDEITKYTNFPEEKIYIVPCAIDKKMYHPNYDKLRIAEFKKKHEIKGEYFCYLGTLEPRKNIEFLIEAYVEWKSKISGELPKLVIAGKRGWKYETIFENVKKYKLDNDVIFLDYIDQKEKPLLLNGARAFLFLSIYEGFGIPPLEAMGCGVPVIVSNVASLPEVVGDAGILVSPTNVNQLVGEMDRLWKDRYYYEEYRKKALIRADYFTWEKAATKLMEIYKIEMEE